MQALDELVARWRKNPDPESTLALCAHLGTSRQQELLREVANTAEAWHRDNPTVMLSVGRMYLDAGLLSEAQAAFVRAGRLATTDSEAYRFLGEVLLRRGDAVRAEKTLARAIKLGDDDPTTRLWHERAIVYGALQKRKGLGAVADEVARTAPHQPSTPSPSPSPFDREPAAGNRPPRRSRPPLAPAPRPSASRRSAPAGSRRRASSPPAVVGKSAPLETLLMGRSPVPVPRLEAPLHPPSPFFPSESQAPTPGPARALAATAAMPAFQKPTAAANGRTPRAVPQPRAGAPAPLSIESRVAATQHADAELRVRAKRHADTARRLDIDPDRHVDTERGVQAEHRVAAQHRLDVHERPGPASSKSDPFRGTFRDAPSTPVPPVWRSETDDPGDDSSPSPETVLLALARVGLYEVESEVVPAWEAVPSPTPRRLWVMGGALVLTLGMGLGGYRYALEVQAERAARAQELGTRLAGLLDSGSRADLTASEVDFQRLFELDSRGREPALLWLKNRALHSLLADEPASGIESALQRARTVGIEESRLVFARLASALGAGDLPGAGQLIAEWDERAKSDALYHLLAGVVFERAGNPDALERYTLATTLQADLKLAHLLAARLAVLQVGPEEARPRLALAYGRLGPGPTSDVLRGLAWAASTTDAPAPGLPSAEGLEDAPPLVRSTASAVEAVRAQREARPGDAIIAFERALGPDATPAMAAWIGYQALDAGNLGVARAAALAAMQASAAHKTSQALAARIALADGRLDAARDVVRGLNPTSRDAVLIEAVSAYERLDGASAVRLLSTLPVSQVASTTLLALRESERAIVGQRRVAPELFDQLADEHQIWGAIVALDIALDHGELELAERIVTARGWTGGVASHAARLMRLRRYQGQLDQALTLAPVLIEPSQATARSIAEVVMTFVDAGRVAAATTTLVDAGEAAGDLGPWLAALVESARGRQASAQKGLSTLTLPGKTEPLLLQVVALRALTLAKDRRARGYHAALEQRFPAHADVLMAGKQLALGK